jgi:hypothetical protein
MRRLATCLKWEVGVLTSAKANGPLNIKGLSLWLAYIYMQLLVTHVYVSMIEGVSLNLEITELSSDWCLFFILKHIPYSTL